MAKVAIMGYGTVGSGVGEVLTMNAVSIEKRAGEPVELKRILDLRDFPGDKLAHLLTKDFTEIEEDPEITVVAECMGGVGAAKMFTERLLRAGKSVVTSNKELVAKFGDTLFELARENHVNYLYEASVGGGIPLIRPIGNCLAANEITEVFGILNGTTNYILTKMITEGTPFDEALKQAQANGYAEADPTADIEGHDACRKTAILASLVGGKHISPDTVETVGITRISAEDVALAAETGHKIKLIGRVVKTGNDVYSAYVSPHLVDRSKLLANVDDVFNGVVVRGNAVNEVMFYGPGAGKLPTASAVAGDVIDAVKHRTQLQKLDWQPGGELSDYRELRMRWYVRFADKCADTLLAERIGDAPAVITDHMTRNELDERLKDSVVLSVMPVLE